MTELGRTLLAGAESVQAARRKVRDVAVALGFGLAFGVLRVAENRVSELLAVLGAILIPIFYWLFLAGPVARALHAVLPIGLEFVPSDDFGGFMLAFIIGRSISTK